MIYNDSLLAVDEQVEALIQTICESQDMRDYLSSRRQLAADEEVAEKQRCFYEAKEAFERVAAYGSYAPDYKEKQLAVYQAKRQLDLTDGMSTFRQKEHQLQEILDTVGLSMAAVISEHIKVDAGNPFFIKGGGTDCRGNCHAN